MRSHLYRAAVGAAGLTLLAATGAHAGRWDDLKSYVKEKMGRGAPAAATPSPTPAPGTSPAVNISGASPLPAAGAVETVTDRFAPVDSDSSAPVRLDFDAHPALDLARSEALNQTRHLFIYDGDVWCGTEGGLKVLNKDRKRWAVADVPLDTVRYMAPVVDADRATAWFYGNELMRCDLRRQEIRRFQPKESDTAIGVQKVALTPSGLVLLSSTGLGFFRYDDERFYRWPTSNATQAPVTGWPPATDGNTVWFVLNDKSVAALDVSAFPAATLRRFPTPFVFPPMHLTFWKGRIWMLGMLGERAQYQSWKPVLASLDPSTGALLTETVPGRVNALQVIDGALIADGDGGSFRRSADTAAWEPVFAVTGAQRLKGDGFVWTGYSHTFQVASSFALRYVLDPSKIGVDAPVETVGFNAISGPDSASLTRAGGDIWLTSGRSLVRFEMASKRAWEYLSGPTLTAGRLLPELFGGATFRTDRPDEAPDPNRDYANNYDDPIGRDGTIFTTARDLKDMWLGVGGQSLPRPEESEPGEDGGEAPSEPPPAPTPTRLTGLWHADEKGWTAVRPTDKDLANPYVTALALNESFLFVGTDQGLYQMNRKNRQWTRRTKETVFRVAANADAIFLFDATGGFSRLPVRGGGAQRVPFPPNFGETDEMAVRSGPVFIANAVFFATDRFVYDLATQRWTALALRLDDACVDPRSGDLVVTGQNKLGHVIRQGGAPQFEETPLRVTLIARELTPEMKSDEEGRPAPFFHLW